MVRALLQELGLPPGALPNTQGSKVHIRREIMFVVPAEPSGSPGVRQSGSDTDGRVAMANVSDQMQPAYENM